MQTRTKCVEGRGEDVTETAERAAVAAAETASVATLKCS